MAEPRDDGFYVGYLPVSPPRIARSVRVAVIALLGLAALLGVLLPALQMPLGSGAFEYGIVREFEGVVRESPYPMLLVARPGVTDPAEAWSGYALVAVDKFSAARDVAGLEGRRARLRGELIYRDGQVMIQVEPGSVEPGEPARAHPSLQRLGPVTLTGEIVDSKCYLGVMKPGNLKPHRACAVRCISGGIPPLLVVRDGHDRPTHVLLVGPDGGALGRELLDHVAEPVRVSGELERWGDLLVLRVRGQQP